MRTLVVIIIIYYIFKTTLVVHNMTHILACSNDYYIFSYMLK